MIEPDGLSPRRVRGDKRAKCAQMLELRGRSAPASQAQYEY
jgi:hypothetical protein